MPSTIPGYSLVELMITIAIISILAAIAVPMYNGYINEGHLTAIRATMNTMRVPIEDFRLENGSYGGNGTLVTDASSNAIGGRYGWEPGSDLGNYQYTVVVVSTGNYNIFGQFTGGGTAWVRCENRLSDCCDSDTSGASAPTAACP